jgi:hypothetical protein
LNTQDQSTETEMNQFTKHTVWTAEPVNQQGSTVEWVKWDATHSKEVADAIQSSSAALREKLEVFDPVAVSEAAAFSLVR